MKENNKLRKCFTFENDGCSISRLNGAATWYPSVTYIESSLVVTLSVSSQGYSAAQIGSVSLDFLET